MNKDLIELQAGVNATCVIIKDEDYRKLGDGIAISSDIKDEYLYQSKLGDPLFKNKLTKSSLSNPISYFIIRNIDSVKKEVQDRFITLVKDRIFHGYNLPDNVIVVFTVKDKQSLKNVSSDLYHFAVVAF